MHPSGNTPYNPASAWEREGEEKTEDLLHGLTERILDPARFKVKDLAGEAYVSLASTPPADQRQAAGPAPNRQDVGCVGDMGKPKIDPTDRKQLPAKRMDLSDYLDQARLTDRQRECASLRHEYGFTVTAIADRLGVSRPTVDEHLEAAERKIELARAKDKARGQRSRFNPEG